MIMLMFNLTWMFLLMFSLFYFTGTPVNFDSLLPVWSITQKSHNKLLKMYNNNITQQLGLNIPQRNKLGIGCENFNTTGEFTYYIWWKLHHWFPIFSTPICHPPTNIILGPGFEVADHGKPWSKLMSSSENPIRQVVYVQVRSRVVGGNISGISVEFSSDIVCKLTNCVKWFAFYS